MLLTATNLTVSYNAITALRDVSVEIARGEIVALIGANGAGKTTLLRAISGLLRPTTGEIKWCPRSDAILANNSIESPGSLVPGTLPIPAPLDYYSANSNLIGMRPDQIVRLGISHVPEGRQIFPDLTVHDNLLLGAFVRKNKEEIRAGIDRAFSLFPVLSERKRQRAGTLSGGEQQMLAIARALMAKPQLLLLDEPSLGLAPIIVQQIFRIIQQLNQDGATIFLVEQNAHMALTIAHRAYVLQTGKVILSDTANKLLEDPEVKKAYLGG